MSEEKKKWYTTGEAARILGISFRTIKRWIYSGKINAVKTAGGHYRIPKETIDRLSVEVEDQFAMDILQLVEYKKIVYLREIQLNLEDRYKHYETNNKLKSLVQHRKINTIYALDRRWFFPADSSWESFKGIAEEKLKLVKVFEDYERGFERDRIKYQDYSEYLVEQAMIRAGYKVVAKDSYYFNGISCVLQKGAGRPPDLDYIAMLPNGVFVGVQVKNRVEYPKPGDIDSLIELCRVLHLRPLLVTRQAHPMTFDVIKRLGGWVVVFKQILLQPGFPRDVFNILREQLGIPIAVYNRPPDYLVKALIDASDAMSKTMSKT